MRGMDLNMCILRMFEDAVSLGAAHLIFSLYSDSDSLLIQTIRAVATRTFYKYFCIIIEIKYLQLTE